MEFITLRSRAKFDLVNIESNVIDPKDVAWALAGIRRWGGHAEPRRSVAMHCLHCVKLAEECGYPMRLQHLLLLHDVEEFVLGDVPTPVKRLYWKNYDEVADRIRCHVHAQWCLKMPSPSEYALMKVIDKMALEWERGHTMTEERQVRDNNVENEWDTYKAFLAALKELIACC